MRQLMGGENANLIVAQTILETDAGRVVRISTVRLLSAFLTDLRDREVYETRLFQDNKSFDCTWAGTRADAVLAHQEKLDLLTLNMSLVWGEHVTHQDHWPLQIEAPNA